MLVYWVAVEVSPVNSKEVFFGHLKLIAILVTFDGLFIYLFVEYIWKWHFLYDKLVPFPDLNGTWQGKIISTWENPETGESTPEIQATLKIRQSFIYIHCLLSTDKIESSSFVCQFDVDKERQRLRLVYSYGGEVNSPERESNPNHFGTAILDIDYANEKLKGRYWTDRGTKGTLNFSKDAK